MAPATNLMTRDAPAPVLTRRYPFQPSTFNEDDNSVEIVISGFAPVQRAGFVEHLSSNPADWMPFPESLPLLDTHKRGSTRDILGHARNLGFRDGLLTGTAVISDPATIEAVRRGDLRGISFGYRAKSHSDRRIDGKVHRTLAGLTAVEVSFTSDPADPSASVRSNPTMEEDIEITESEVTSETRATVNVHIRSFEGRGLDRSFLDTLIDTAPTLDEANAAIRGELANRRPVAITIGRSSEDPAVQRSFEAEAMTASLIGGAEPSEGARPFMPLGGSMLRHAVVCLTREGVANVATMSTDEIVTRALATTSDFNLLMGDVTNRIVLASYGAAETPLKRLGRLTNLPDFRDAQTLRVGPGAGLKEVTEAGEIQSTVPLETGESFRLKTYATKMPLSRQLIINDNANALTQWGTDAGIMAANLEHEQIASLFLAGSGAGPVLSDGKRWFHADHGNLAASGAAPDVDELSAARLALRTQTALDGKTLINATPKYLLVAADLETVGEQLLANLNAATISDVNPFANKLELLVDPLLLEGSWYVASQLPTFAYGYLSGAPGPQLSSREGWDVLGREFRVILDFGCGVIDHRGIYRNPGDAI